VQSSCEYHLFKWIDIRLSSLEVDCSDFNRQTTDVHSTSATYVLKTSVPVDFSQRV